MSTIHASMLMGWLSTVLGSLSVAGRSALRVVFWICLFSSLLVFSCFLFVFVSLLCAVHAVQCRSCSVHDYGRDALRLQLLMDCA